MAGRGGPSFLKRQKEQKRAARALEKRAAKQARRDSRAAAETDEPRAEEVSAEPAEQDREPDGSPEG
jgi:hypothetical protein